MKHSFAAILLVTFSLTVFAQESETDCSPANRRNLNMMELTLCASYDVDNEVAKLVAKTEAVCEKTPEVKDAEGGSGHTQALSVCSLKKIKALIKLVK